MQSLSSLVFLAITIIVLMVQWILPMLNLHLALNQEALLDKKAGAIVDAARVNPGNVLNDLQRLIISGIEIKQVSEETRGDYILYKIQFKHNGLFANQFLQKSDLEESKVITLISDRL